MHNPEDISTHITDIGLYLKYIKNCYKSIKRQGNIENWERISTDYDRIVSQYVLYPEHIKNCWKLTSNHIEKCTKE